MITQLAWGWLRYQPESELSQWYMWSRRHFLESISALPLIGGFIGAGGASATVAAAGGGRDYFKELGIRPFINAAGTYTAMTASLMPPEVMDVEVRSRPALIVAVFPCVAAEVE